MNSSEAGKRPPPITDHEMEIAERSASKNQKTNSPSPDTANTENQLLAVTQVHTLDSLIGGERLSVTPRMHQFFSNLTASPEAFFIQSFAQQFMMAGEAFDRKQGEFLQGRFEEWATAMNTAIQQKFQQYHGAIDELLQYKINVLQQELQVFHQSAHDQYRSFQSEMKAIAINKTAPITPEHSDLLETQSRLQDTLATQHQLSAKTEEIITEVKTIGAQLKSQQADTCNLKISLQQMPSNFRDEMTSFQSATDNSIKAIQAQLNRLILEKSEETDRVSRDLIKMKEDQKKSTISLKRSMSKDSLGSLSDLGNPSTRILTERMEAVEQALLKEKENWKNEFDKLTKKQLEWEESWSYEEYVTSTQLTHFKNQFQAYILQKLEKMEQHMNKPLPLQSPGNIPPMENPVRQTPTDFDRPTTNRRNSDPIPLRRENQESPNTSPIPPHVWNKRARTGTCSLSRLEIHPLSGSRHMKSTNKK